MSCAGFGRPANWTESVSTIPAGHTMTLTNSIFNVVTHLPHILLCPNWLLARSPWKIAYEAYVDFDKYMHEFLASEKAELSRNSDYEGRVRGNLLTAILKSSTESSEKGNEVTPGVRRTTFTDNEVLGNVFMFLMAGYDSTANVIIYSALSLALNGSVQDKMIDEIDRVYSEAAQAGRSELSYSEDLPKFRYVLAFMVSRL